MKHLFKKFIILLCITITSSIAEVNTNTEVIKSEGIGEGKSRIEAVNNALAEAIEKISGVKIKQNVYLNDINKVNNSYIKKISSGKVDTFEVLEVKESIFGNYTAKVLVSKTNIEKSYKKPGITTNKRNSIVVVQTGINNKTLKLFNDNYDLSFINKDYKSEIMNSLIKTRKYNVLDRDETNVYNSEKKLIKSYDVPEDELLKLGLVMGADYILVTNIEDIITENDKNSFTSVALNNDSLTVIFQYKLLIMATREVKLFQKENIEFTPNGDSNNQKYFNMIKHTSNMVIDNLIENMFPLKVINVERKNVFLNQGNIKLGTKYEVYSLGKELFDDYTKESLGRSETKVGLIEVIKSLPKYSIATIIEGNVEKGNISRKLSNIGNLNSKQDNNGKESSVLSKNGGVQLSF